MKKSITTLGIPGIAAVSASTYAFTGEHKEER